MSDCIGFTLAASHYNDRYIQIPEGWSSESDPVIDLLRDIAMHYNHWLHGKISTDELAACARNMGVLAKAILKEHGLEE